MSREDAVLGWSYRRFDVPPPTGGRLRNISEAERGFEERGVANTSDGWFDHLQRNRD